MINQTILQTTPIVSDWHLPNMPADRAQDGDTDGETSPQADVLVAEPEATIDSNRAASRRITTSHCNADLDFLFIYY